MSSLVSSKIIMRKLFVAVVLAATAGFGQTHSKLSTTSSTESKELSATRIHKPPLDERTFDYWDSVSSPHISNDGQYFAYTIRHTLYSSLAKHSSTLVLRSMKGSWEQKIEEVRDVSITSDSRLAIFIKNTDQLCTVKLGTSSTECIPGVKSFQLIKQEKHEWLAYLKGDSDKSLILNDLTSAEQLSFPGVTAYSASKNGQAIVAESDAVSEAGQTVLNWINLPSGKIVTFWHGPLPSKVIFDSSGTQAAFAVEQKSKDFTVHSYWYYKAGTETAVQLADDKSPGLGEEVHLGALKFFSNDGTRIFFAQTRSPTPPAPAEAVKVDLWSYTDPKLQSQQLGRVGSPYNFTSVVDVDSRRILRLQNDDEYTNLRYEGKPDQFAFITAAEGDSAFESNWNRLSQPRYFWVSTITGERKSISMPLAESGTAISNDGKWLILEDQNHRNLYSYEVATGQTRNLSKNLPIPLVDPDYNGTDRLTTRRFTLAAWVQDSAAILAYDPFDIWQLDPAGKRPPINLTNGYGRRHGIVLRLTGDPNRYRQEEVAPNARLLLAAFNRKNKNNGFYAKVLGQSGDPERLSMGPYLYDMPSYINATFSFGPLRVGETRGYVVQRCSAEESPNFFYTIDFKTFTPISSVHPEKAYNWYTTELLSWKTLDGSMSQGVLYKPDDFDPHKKYPLIINYYERKSQNLHRYDAPEAMTDDLPIPWFVSHGYLVFTPDIHYKIGHTGTSAYNAVVSGAQYLTRFPWVDAAHIGIQGHSFGGYETNYLIAHTNMFAAAMSSSGFADLASAYGAVSWGGTSFWSWWAEADQGRIGATLWQRPELYIENSPIFRADRVTTPLLMMNNKGDDSVPFSQGVEWFTVLRRLGKRVWMLQYDGQGHSIADQKAARQHTVRVMQFFDHYLKGAPAPKWMTEGVPASLKGVDAKLELDNRGLEPAVGALFVEPKQRTISHTGVVPAVQREQ